VRSSPTRTLTTMLTDLRYGIRQLRKDPGFTTVAVLTLALGIGANTAIFSLVDAVLLRPLPFKEPDRLVMIWEDASRTGFPRNNPTPATYMDWKSQNTVFEDVAALSWSDFNLTGDGEPEKIEGNAVTANFFSLLGVPPVLGRPFVSEEDRAGGRKVVILSHGLWQRRFGGDPNVIAMDILLNGDKFAIVGVMPASFQFLGRELWVPIAFSQQQLSKRDAHYLGVVARLKVGVSLAQAQAEIQAITARIAQDHPVDAQDLRAYLLPLREQLAGTVRPALLVLQIAVGCVLLIACSNIANLLLSRAAVRKKEMAIRASLGASRWRLVRQLLTESVLLAGCGGLLGLFLAGWSIAFLTQLIPEDMKLSAIVGIDAEVFGYTLLLSIFTGLLFGIAPALQTAGLDLNACLKQGGSGRVSDRSRRRLRSALVVGEVSLALVLLTGAGLMIQTFVYLQRLDLGIRPENVLTVSATLPWNRYGEIAKRSAFYDQVLRRVKALPGVVSAGFTTAIPLTWKGGTSDLTIEGQAPEPGRDAIHRQVSADYFRTMGIQLRQGRALTEEDGPRSLPVAVVNETMARQFWPNETAVGKRFKLGSLESSTPWLTIVGVTADIRQMGLDVPVKAEMYVPYPQVSYNFVFAPRALAVRSTTDPMQLAAAVRREIWAVDPQQPVSNIRTMEEILASEVSQRSIAMTLLAAFAALALLLAGLGIYGVLSYLVAQRRQEIGIRMALGARRMDILQMVVGEGMRWSIVGMAIGLSAAFALTRVMSSVLYGVSATDPVTFAFVSLLLIAISFIACYVPARRAARVDPMTTLRCE